MIYIISDETDISTSEVIEWLNTLNKNVSRIGNLIDIDNKFILYPIKLPISTEENIFSTMQYSIWARRFQPFYDIGDVATRNYYWYESKALVDFALQQKFNKRRIIGVSDFGISVNKLEILNIISNYGLLVPATIITNSKEDIYAFYREHKKIISKAMSDAFKDVRNNKAFIAYTKIVTKKFIDSLPEIFPTLLFQQYIEKEYEIRIFYLDGKLYPMAIFSQNSGKTKIDFRKYDSKKPNRTVPCKLPKNVEENLLRFMKEYKLDAASVDMVKCKNTGNYYFLEVNSQGQFGMVSKPCNYYLEKKIAEVL